jgi:hypothetical protein
LRVLWNATKAGNAPLLDGLTPLVRVRENGKSRAPGFAWSSVLAGAEMAAKLCGVLIASRSCQPAAFEGQQFAQSVPEPEQTGAGTGTPSAATASAPAAAAREPVAPQCRPSPRAAYYGLML